MGKGQITGVAMKIFSGEADGGLVSKIIAEEMKE